MKKAKKLLVTLLILTFMLSTFSVGFAADKAEEKLPTEVVRAQALGILKGDTQGNLNLDKPITRAEALALIIRISGLETSSDLMKGQTRFADANTAPSLQWATGYINLGVSQEIINGFPDGTFKGNDQVTYAEMAKMLIYAMNYGVTVQGAQWPAGVMAKADDLELFDKVNATPNLPALRGDVVKMIDNSLTVKHLEQTGYGDFKQYEEGDKTFLSKMNVDELEDVRVTAVDVKKSRITIAKKAYKVLADVDVDSLLGMEVTAWANDDDEIFFIDPEWDDVKVDIVKENVSKDATKMELKIADKSYKIADNVEVYVNGESKDLKDLKAGYYGYFVLNDDDQILYVNVKNWNEVNAGVVTKVDTKDNIINYFEQDDNDNELDLDDPDDGYVIALDGKAIEAEDIEKNDVIYVAEYDDIYYMIVVRNAVEGKVERVKEDEIRIDGKNYDVAENMASYSIDEDKEIKPFDADAIKDMAGEAALAILDIAGEVRHITSDVESTSDTIYGVVTRANAYNDNFRIFANGTSTSYDLDGDIYVGGKNSDGDFEWVKHGLDIYGITRDDGHYPVVKYELNKDGEIDDLYVLAIWDESNVVSPATGAIVVDTVCATVDEFDEDHDTIKTDKGTYFVTSTTSIVDEITDMDAVEWKDIKEKTAKDAKAIVVSNSRDDAKLVVFVKDTFSAIADDEEVGVVTDKFVEDGDWKATVQVHGGKEEDYFLNAKGDVEIGQVIKFRVNSDNEIDIKRSGLGVKVKENNEGVITGFDVTGTVTKKDGNYLTVQGSTYGEYRVDSRTIIYDVTDGLNDIDKARLTDVKAKRTNVGLVTDGRLIQVLYIVDEADVDENDNKANITAEHKDGKINMSVSNIDDAYAVRIYDYDSGDAIGGFQTLSDGKASITSVENPVFISVKVYDDAGKVLAEERVSVK